jgi:tRNA threonylcarbamoyladenosine biosynthesis protein TsaB
MSLEVCHGEQVWTHDGPGGAQTSNQLIPAVMTLLSQAKLTLAGLDAIAFGRGPGAFTGLRTACSVSQGLALGAGLPLLPVDTLLCLAETARARHHRVLSLLDARMGQVYAAAYEWRDASWQALFGPLLTYPQQLRLPESWEEQPYVLAGNAMSAHSTALQHLVTSQVEVMACWPQAEAMLRLAASAWSRSEAVDAALALPLYLRDDVARTTAQRLADKLAAP